MVAEEQLLAHLNEPQRQAVSQPPGHQRIIAGAGSGKTRVLVHRIAWLVKIWNIPPQAILAVTFTNKAASAMRTRVENLLGEHIIGLWLGTFHSICHRLLRMHHQTFGLDQKFQVIDQEDQLRLIKKIQRSANLDDKTYPARKTQYYINQHKERRIRAKDADGESEYTSTLKNVYENYEKNCITSHLVDFNELILRVVETLESNQSLREHLQGIYRYILVDEFQDTNQLQYQLIQILAGSNNFITIVGDDDQSIYSWRGAEIENIRSFNSSYPDATTIKLEQNYRSTGHILQAANAIIAYNQDRIGKDLWTDRGLGNKIQLLCAYNEHDEARYIVDTIGKNRAMGHNYQEHAVLYRSNAQSRVIEEQLTRANIPYIIFGGLRFFERAEIKDALAYLRILVHPDDDSAFERIINIPPRGIGPASVDKLRLTAKEEGISMWQSMLQHLEHQTLPKRLHEALTTFKELFTHLQPKAPHYSLAELVEHILQLTGLIAYQQKNHPETAKNKLENLQELINALQQYETTQENSSTLLLASQFIADITIDNRNPHEKEVAQDQVQLMTLHTAKGLEFQQVFLTGLEEGLFPHKMALQEGRELEEERRLCYVGMTRAMETLHLSHAENRRLYQQEQYQLKSRFLQEIPDEHIVHVSTSMQPTHSYLAQPTHTQWPLGSQVKHPSFGEGTILNVEGHGPQCRIQVRFRDAGMKWLIAEYARLEPCN